jgi:hypothetical protein
MFLLAESCPKRDKRRYVDSMQSTGLRLAQVTRENFKDACALHVKPEQEGVVASVTESLAAAYVARDIVWPRLVYDGD